MIRTYSDKRIYKNFKISLRLSIVSLAIAVLSVIAHACAYFLREPKPTVDSMQIFILVLFYLLMIMVPLAILAYSAKSLRPVKEGVRNANKETKWHNDCISMAFPIILSFVPFILLIGSLISWLIFLCFGDSDASNPIACARMCGYMLPSHVFAYIADIFLKNNGILIQREWQNDPPEFVKREGIKITKRQEEKAKQKEQQAQQKAEAEKQRNEARCRSLLQRCGMKFFVKYYRQIKMLPVRDIVISETYSPAERDERLAAAAKIIDSNLAMVALDIIINVYGNRLQGDEIEQAKKLLADIVSEQSSVHAEPCAEPNDRKQTAELYDPYDE